MSNERTEDMRLDDIFEKGKIALFKLLDEVSGEKNTGMHNDLCRKNPL